MAPAAPVAAACRNNICQSAADLPRAIRGAISDGEAIGDCPVNIPEGRDFGRFCPRRMAIPGRNGWRQPH